MNEIDKILGTKKKSLNFDSMFSKPIKKQNKFSINHKPKLDLDGIFPNADPTPYVRDKTARTWSKLKNPTIVVNNYYNSPPGGTSSSANSPKRHLLSTLEGEAPPNNDFNVPTPLTKQINKSRSNQILKDVLGED